MRTRLSACCRRALPINFRSSSLVRTYSGLAQAAASDAPRQSWPVEAGVVSRGFGGNAVAPASSLLSAEEDRQGIFFFMTPNERYAQHAAACMASLVRHSAARFDVVIASTDDPAGFAERISRSFAGNDRVSLEYRQFRLPAHTHFPVVNNLSLDAYLRFWVDE